MFKKAAIDTYSFFIKYMNFEKKLNKLDYTKINVSPGF
jgi:hypothetical protein